MNAKITLVALECDGATRELELHHAERLLRMTKAGWKFPEDSKFEFKDNAIRYKDDTGSDKGRSKKGRH